MGVFRKIEGSHWEAIDGGVELPGKIRSVVRIWTPSGSNFTTIHLKNDIVAISSSPLHLITASTSGTLKIHCFEENAERLYHSEERKRERELRIDLFGGSLATAVTGLAVGFLWTKANS